MAAIGVAKAARRIIVLGEEEGGVVPVGTSEFFFRKRPNFMQDEHACVLDFAIERRQNCFDPFD